MGQAGNSPPDGFFLLLRGNGRRWFRYEAVRALNPSIIYVSISGFGATGPYSKQMVYDFVIQALCGKGQDTI